MLSNYVIISDQAGPTDIDHAGASHNLTISVQPILVHNPCTVQPYVDNSRRIYQVGPTVIGRKILSTVQLCRILYTYLQSK